MVTAADDVACDLIESECARGGEVRRGLPRQKIRLRAGACRSRAETGSYDIAGTERAARFAAQKREPVSGRRSSFGTRHLLGSLRRADSAVARRIVQDEPRLPADVHLH